MSRTQPATRSSAPTVAGVRISHPDRLIYRDEGISKVQFARYYESVGEWILPHVKGRPLTLVHCPAGIASPCIYLKHAKPPKQWNVQLRGDSCRHSSDWCRKDSRHAHGAQTGGIDSSPSWWSNEAAPRLLVAWSDALATAYDERRQRDQAKLEQMVICAQTAMCRTAMLLDGLGEPGFDRCGTCDNCSGTAMRAEAAAQRAA